MADPGYREMTARQRLQMLKEQQLTGAIGDQATSRYAKNARRKDFKAQADDPFANVKFKGGERVVHSRPVVTSNFATSRTGKTVRTYGEMAGGILSGPPNPNKPKFARVSTGGRNLVDKAKQWTTEGFRDIGPTPVEIVGRKFEQNINPKRRRQGLKDRGLAGPSQNAVGSSLFGGDK